MILNDVRRGLCKLDSEAMKPYGKALLDFYRGDTTVAVTIYRDDNEVTNLAVNTFFRDITDMPFDKIALDYRRGRVLDVGAGAGLHSLYLQDHGFSVCAIDVSSEACEIMRESGVKEVYCADISYFESESFDTPLLLGRAIGMVENLQGLGSFLVTVRRLVKHGGQIIMNSLDVSCTGDPLQLAYQEVNRRDGRYIGEIRMQFEYKGLKGPFCGWLHVDPATLSEHAAEAGWFCEVIIQEKDGNYLARLTKT